MNINTLLDRICVAVAQDTDIKNWCLLNYGKTHTAYYDLDQRNYPDGSNCPYVFAAPDTKDVGRVKSVREQSVEVGCLVDASAHSTDATFEADDDIPNLYRFPGSKRIEEFRKLVETAIMGIDIGNASWSVVGTIYDTIGSYPYIKAEMQFELIETVTLGSDPLI